MTTATLGFAIDSSPASSAAVDLDKLTAAAVKTERTVGSLEDATRGLGGALSAAGKGAEGARGPVDGLGRAFGSQDEHVRAFRMELDRLTAKYQPMAQATKSYEAAIGEINRAHQLGVINAQQMQKALDGERQAYERLKTSASGAGQAIQTANKNSPGGQKFNAANAGYQFQDIAVTAAMGMNPLMIGLQQGTQLASVVGSMERPVAGLAAAFGSLVSPVSLVTIGLTAGVAALIQYFTTAETGTGKTTALFAEQNEVIRKAAELWGDAVPAFTAYVDQLDRADKLSQGKQAGEILGGRELEGLAEKLGNVKREAIEAFRSLQGDPNNAVLVRDLRTAWGELRTKLEDGSASMADLNNVQRELSNAVDQYGTPAVLKFKAAFDLNTEAIYKSVDAAQKARLAYIEAIAGGTSVQDILAGSTFNDNGKTYKPSDFQPQGNIPHPLDRPKIELEGLPGEQKDDAKQQSNYDRAIDAAKQRIAQTELETQVAGKLGAASDALRFKLNLLHDAQDKGKEITADQRKEIDALAEAYERAAAAASDARFNAALSQQISDAHLDARSRQIVQTQRQYGLAEGADNSTGQRIGQQYDWQQAKDLAKGFGSAFGNELISGSHDLGKALLKGLQSTLENEASKLWEKFFDGVGNMFADWLTGSKGSGASSGGAISSVVSAITGKSANDNSAGAFSGLGKVIPVTRMALPDVGSTKGGIDLAKISTSSGLSASVNKQYADRFQGLIGDLEGAGYNIKSLGGYNYRNIAGSSKLSNHAFGNAIDINPGTNPMGRSLVTDMPPNVSALAAQNGLLWGGDWNSKKDAMHFEVASSKSAAEALDKLAGSSTEATKGLGSLASSLGTSFFPAAPSAPAQSGGGLGGLFGSLFGGGLSAAQIAKYTPMVGLFADGTNYAPGGMAIVGERGPELVNLPQGSQVFNTNKSQQMMGGAANQNGSTGRPELHVHVYGGSGDNHIRELSRQGAQEAIYQYDQGQVRGGFIDNQQKVTARKG